MPNSSGHRNGVLVIAVSVIGVVLSVQSVVGAAAAVGAPRPDKPCLLYTSPSPRD